MSNWHPDVTDPMPPGFRDTVSRIARKFAAGEAIEGYWAKAIASDDIAHGRDRCGFTTDQRKRYCLYVRVTNQGLDPSRVAFARFLVARGRIRG